MRGQSNHSSRFIEMFGTIDNPKVPVKRMIDISVSSGQYGLNASAVDFIDGRPRYIRITDICDDGSLNDDIKCSDIDDSAYLVKNGDVLFARTGATVGKTYLHRAGDACFAGYLIRYSFTEVVDPEYILAYTHSATYYDWVLKSQKVGAQPNISASQYDNMPVLIPSITEQEEFLHLFRQSDKSKFANFKSRFIEMFETTVHVYEEIPITALCYTDDDIKCGPFGTQLKQSEYQENGVAVWGIPQINSGFSIAPDTFVTPEKAKRLEQFSLISGDIAMSRKGNVGQCALFPDNFEKGIIASDVVRIRVNKNLIMPQFLVYQLHNSHKVRRQILNVSDGSIMAGINVTKLKKIHVYSPPLERQKQFVSIVRQVDKSKYLS